MNMSDETVGYEGEIKQLKYLVQYVDVQQRTTLDLELYDSYDEALTEVNNLTDGGMYTVDDITMFNIEFVNVVI